ncbi:hypothetical protein ACFE04_018754 [Oxalis oulophora]
MSLLEQLLPVSLACNSNNQGYPKIVNEDVALSQSNVVPVKKWTCGSRSKSNPSPLEKLTQDFYMYTKLLFSTKDRNSWMIPRTKGDVGPEFHKRQNLLLIVIAKGEAQGLVSKSIGIACGLVFSEYLLSGQAPPLKEINDEEPLFPAFPSLSIKSASQVMMLNPANYSGAITTLKA